MGDLILRHVLIAFDVGLVIGAVTAYVLQRYHTRDVHLDWDEIRAAIKSDAAMLGKLRRERNDRPRAKNALAHRSGDFKPRE